VLNWLVRCSIGELKTNCSRVGLRVLGIGLSNLVGILSDYYGCDLECLALNMPSFSAPFFVNSKL
jgi:hypothetical protein